MTDAEFSKLLRETALLMEIDGDSAFRIRAYRETANKLEIWPAGIARSMRAVVEGVEARRAELLKKYPATLLDLLGIPGLGPRRVALIWECHHAGSAGDVARLCREHRLQRLPSIGPKIEGQILRYLETRGE